MDICGRAAHGLYTTTATAPPGAVAAHTDTFAMWHCVNAVAGPPIQDERDALTTASPCARIST